MTRLALLAAVAATELWARVARRPERRWTVYENPDELGYYALMEEHW